MKPVTAERYSSSASPVAAAILSFNLHCLDPLSSVRDLLTKRGAHLALGFAVGPELTKRPFLSHKRTKEERAWPRFQRNQSVKGQGITKRRIGLGRPVRETRQAASH
jgi:hypothetical protein